MYRKLYTMRNCDRIGDLSLLQTALLLNATNYIVSDISKVIKLLIVTNIRLLVFVNVIHKT